MNLNATDTQGSSCQRFKPIMHVNECDQIFKHQAQKQLSKPDHQHVQGNEFKLLSWRENLPGDFFLHGFTEEFNLADKPHQHGEQSRIPTILVTLHDYCVAPHNVKKEVPRKYRDAECAKNIKHLEHIRSDQQSELKEVG